MRGWRWVDDPARNIGQIRLKAPLGLEPRGTRIGQTRCPGAARCRRPDTRRPRAQREGQVARHAAQKAAEQVQRLQRQGVVRLQARSVTWAAELTSLPPRCASLRSAWYRSTSPAPPPRARPTHGRSALAGWPAHQIPAGSARPASRARPRPTAARRGWPRWEYQARHAEPVPGPTSAMALPATAAPPPTWRSCAGPAWAKASASAVKSLMTTRRCRPSDALSALCEKHQLWLVMRTSSPVTGLAMPKAASRGWDVHLGQVGGNGRVYRGELGAGQHAGVVQGPSGWSCQARRMLVPPMSAKAGAGGHAVL